MFVTTYYFTGLIIILYCCSYYLLTASSSKSILSPPLIPHHHIIVLIRRRNDSHCFVRILVLGRDRLLLLAASNNPLYFSWKTTSSYGQNLRTRFSLVVIVFYWSVIACIMRISSDCSSSGVGTCVLDKLRLFVYGLCVLGVNEETLDIQFFVHVLDLLEDDVLQADNTKDASPLLWTPLTRPESHLNRWWWGILV